MKHTIKKLKIWWKSKLSGGIIEGRIYKLREPWAVDKNGPRYYRVDEVYVAIGIVELFDFNESTITYISLDQFKEKFVLTDMIG